MPATSPRPSPYRDRGDSRLHGERAAVHHVTGRRRIPRLAFYVLCLAATYLLAVFMVRPHVHVPRSRFLGVLAPASTPTPPPPPLPPRPTRHTAMRGVDAITFVDAKDAANKRCELGEAAATRPAESVSGADAMRWVMSTGGRAALFQVVSSERVARFAPNEQGLSKPPPALRRGAGRLYVSGYGASQQGKALSSSSSSSSWWLCVASAGSAAASRRRRPHRAQRGWRT